MQHGYLRRFAPVDVLTERGALGDPPRRPRDPRDLRRQHPPCPDPGTSRGGRLRSSTAPATQVRIPPALAEECLSTVPSSYQIVARDRAMDVRIGGDRVHFLQGMGMRYVDTDDLGAAPGHPARARRGADRRRRAAQRARHGRALQLHRPRRTCPGSCSSLRASPTVSATRRSRSTMATSRTRTSSPSRWRRASA